MKSLVPVLGCVLFFFVSCNKERFSEDSGRMMPISIVTSVGDAKVELSSDRSKFVWSEGDQFTLFNNVNNAVAAVSTASSPVSAEVPGGTSAVYAISPASDYTSGPGEVTVNLPAVQQQTAAGSLAGMYYPFTAKSDVKDNAAALSFTPAVAVLAFNVYRSADFDVAETVERITVTPVTDEGLAGTCTLDLRSDLWYKTGDSGDKMVSVELTTPCAVGDGKPAVKRTYEDQVYLLLARQKYEGGFRIEVKTNKNYYLAVTSSTFDCTTYDVIVADFNLSTKTVEVCLESSIPAMNYIIPSTNVLAGIDDPLLLNVGATTVDKIPDFSRVGYHYGDIDPPFVPVKMTLTVDQVWKNTIDGGGTYADSTAYVQAMVDSVAAMGGGCLLFKNGTYHLSRTIFLDHDNLVIRGEDKDETIFYGDGNVGWTMFFIGHSLLSSTSSKAQIWNGRVVVESGYTAGFYNVPFGDYYLTIYSPSASVSSLGQATTIVEDYVPVGRMYVEVQNPDLFTVGAKVAVCRPHSNEWITDIGMDKIASNGKTRSVVKNSPTSQWNTENHTRYWYRQVTAILGNRIYLDCPIVQSLDRAYGGGKLYVMANDVAVRECGIENITVDSWYDQTMMYTAKPALEPAAIPECYHESHLYTAIEVKSAENCWVRNVDTRHLGHGVVSMREQARKITVDNCHSYEPCSYISGNRRYAFICSGNACQCLIKNCTTDRDRHSFATTKNEGPNVFLYCTATRSYDGPEPHQRWCTGSLFDNVVCLNTHLYVRDRGNAGNGHGMAGANYVIFNCQCRSIEASNPWAREFAPEVETTPGGYTYHSDHPSGQNWCIGSVGTKKLESANFNSPYFKEDGYQEDYFKDVLKLHRPDGFWYPEREPETTGSLSDRINLNNVPDDLKAKSWWPDFSGKVQFSNPESLYMSQLEDRHARGIVLNSL